GSVIQGLLIGAQLAVNIAGRATGLELIRQQGVINTQPRIATECKTTIVPPGKGAAALLKQTVGIVQAQCQQTLERSALGRGYQNIDSSFDRVVNVLVGWGNIIVAQNG